MNCAKTKAAMKPPAMLPSRHPQMRKVIGPKDQADRRMHVVLQHSRQAPRPAKAPPSAEALRRCAPGSRPSAA